MSYPILYGATETKFDNNGIGILSACVSCEVMEEANGAFELSLRYPMDGIHFDKIGDRCIIKAKPNKDAKEQLFRVYSISKPMSGIVTVLAAHISYDLSGIPVPPFSARNAPEAMKELMVNAVVPCDFNFRTDKSTVAEFSVDVPGSIRSKLGGVQGSIIDVYGGELEFDNFDVILHNSRGKDKGVSIRYGKNLTDIQQEQNCAAVATGVYPYWVDSDGADLVELPEKIVNVPGTYDFVKIRMLDLSSEFETRPTVEQLSIKAKNYVRSNNIGTPKVSLSVSFAQLEQSEEYRGLQLLDSVSLFDTVSVEFPDLRVSAKAKAVKVVYDVIADRVKSVTLGSVRANIADTVANQQQQIENAPTLVDVKRASSAATSWLTNGRGYKVERRDENGNTIDTLYMDHPDTEMAENVLRIGQSGIGFSKNGVDGPYFSAWTLDGSFDASYIRSGQISSYGEAFLAPTIDDVTLMLLSFMFPNAYPQNDYFDVDGNGVFDLDDVRLAYSVAMGMEDVNALASKQKTPVSVIIDPFDPYKTISIIGQNMWGSEVLCSFGTNQAKLPPISGDAVVGGRLFVGESASFKSLSLSEFGQSENAKTLAWKDNGDGTFTLIGK